MNTQIIAKNLVRLRLSQNWTQEEMSDKLHISRQAISKWETGAALPNLEALLELSKLYNISMNEIIEPSFRKLISDFEEIIGLDTSIISTSLSLFSASEIVKASMGASPEICGRLEALCRDINFDKERNEIGKVRIAEIENIHNRIVDTINLQLAK
ncbi:MAG: hypothetical protein K0S76_1753 [Herbinix sp.]|jgi:transcriptional regulator with XRE-family HTH domain|nr:hypothetical protein [Herbinix sp.]